LTLHLKFNVLSSLLFICLYALYNNVSCQNNTILDSLDHYYNLSKVTDLDYNQRFNYALKSKDFALQLGVDSLRLKVQRELSMFYFNQELYDDYVSINQNNFALANSLQDSSAVSVAASNLATYYRYMEMNDSSYIYYSKALNHYKPNEVSDRKVKALLYLADVQQVEKIYAGAERDAIRAITLLDKLPINEERLELYWNLNNLLAIVSEILGNHGKAIAYYDKSIANAEKITSDITYQIYSKNNKAGAFRTAGNYPKALELFQELLDAKEDYDTLDPTLYPTVITNIAKTKFESGNYNFQEVERQLLEAYSITKDIEDDYILMAVASELAKVYAANTNNAQAKRYANEALELANSFSNNEYKMEVLKTLSDVLEGEQGKAMLNQYITLSDSLQNAERTVRNKFARIKYESDQLEAENKQISKENFYLLMLSAGLMLTAILVYVIISQRAKNKELKLIQLQQKANEDIYNLMLSQQDKVDEARAQEKTRVSKELHDGVLGRLFGVRLSLDSLNFSEGKEAIQNRSNYIGQLKTIEDDIRKISHEMNTDFVSGAGFMTIVSELIETQTKAYGLTNNFQYRDDISWDYVSNKTKINIYRIIQESMQNIYKHADAKHIDISISRKKDVICLDIIDDGKGFDIKKSKKGIGLKNMTSRVKDIDGTIDFISQPYKGTTVNVTIPYLVN